MNKDRIKGKVKDVAGRVERQAGEWTGDSKTQAEASQNSSKVRCRMPGARSKTLPERSLIKHNHPPSRLNRLQT